MIWGEWSLSWLNCPWFYRQFILWQLSRVLVSNKHVIKFIHGILFHLWNHTWSFFKKNLTFSCFLLFLYLFCFLQLSYLLINWFFHGIRPQNSDPSITIQNLSLLSHQPLGSRFTHGSWIYPLFSGIHVLMLPSTSLCSLVLPKRSGTNYPIWQSIVTTILNKQCSLVLTW